MPYKITIEKIEHKEYPETKSVWIDHAGDITENYNVREKSVARETGMMLTRIDRTEVLSQQVDEIDLQAVIKAVNQIV